MSGVLLRHALEIRKQRCKFLGIGEKVVDLFRFPLHFELTAELDRHFLCPFGILRGKPNRLEDVLVPGAAASIAGNGLAYFLLVRLLVRREQLVSGEQQARRTVAALQAVGLAEGLLNRMKLPIFFQTLDRNDFRTIGLNRENRA